MKRCCTRFASGDEDARGARSVSTRYVTGCSSRRRYLRRCCLSKAHRFDSKYVHTALSARQWRFLSLCIKLFRWLRRVPRSLSLSGLPPPAFPVPFSASFSSLTISALSPNPTAPATLFHRGFNPFFDW